MNTYKSAKSIEDHQLCHPLPTQSGARARSMRSRFALGAAAPLAALMLAGCASVQGAVDGVQGAVDGAQSMLAAPQQIAEACQTAVTALAPGEVAADAQQAMRDATTQLDAALGSAAAIPGISAVRDAFAGAMQSLSTTGDTAQSIASREAVVTACALFTGN